MNNERDRNQEFDEVINKDKKEYLNFFITDLECELDDIASTLDTESSKILINWVRDKVHKLHEDYNADL